MRKCQKEKMTNEKPTVNSCSLCFCSAHASVDLTTLGRTRRRVKKKNKKKEIEKFLLMIFKYTYGGVGARGWEGKRSVSFAFTIAQQTVAAGCLPASSSEQTHLIFAPRKKGNCFFFESGPFFLLQKWSEFPDSCKIYLSFRAKYKICRHLACYSFFYGKLIVTN